MYGIYKVAVVAAVVGAVIGSVWAANDSGPARPSSTHQSSNYDSAFDYYTNVDGNRVHRPMFADKQPPNATAQCADGAYSFSQHVRGTCNYHGGVLRWLQH